MDTANAPDLGFVKSFILSGLAAYIIFWVVPPSWQLYATGAIYAVLLLVWIDKGKLKYLQSDRSCLGLMMGAAIGLLIFTSQSNTEKTPMALNGGNEAQVELPATIIADLEEKDFRWDKNTSPWKSTIIKGVNKVRRENPKCAKLDPTSVDVSLNKGTKKNPVFYVTCEPQGETVFNFFFSKSDVDVEKVLKAAPHVSKERAAKLCEEYAKSQAQNPQTVKFSTILDLSIQEFPNGNTRVNSSFTASNLMGISSSYNVNCTITSEGVIYGSITNQN